MAVELTTARSEQLTTIAVVARLVTRISHGDRPLGAIADTLDELTIALDAIRVVVAVDDIDLGRQVFTSARAPLGTEPIGLFGAPGTWTEPGGRLDGDEAELVTASVGIALHALAQAAPPAPPAPPATASLVAPASVLHGAVARAVAHGWTFTLALVRFDDGDHGPARTNTLRAGLRAGDTVIDAGREAALVLLPAARDDEAAAILAAAVRNRGLPRCAFGLARCPDDADAPAALVDLATRRLGDALTARDPSAPGS